MLIVLGENEAYWKEYLWIVIKIKIHDIETMSVLYNMKMINISIYNYSYSIFINTVAVFNLYMQLMISTQQCVT